MKQLLILVLLILFIHTVRAEEGPTYNFNFHNGAEQKLTPEQVSAMPAQAGPMVQQIVKERAEKKERSFGFEYTYSRMESVFDFDHKNNYVYDSNALRRFSVLIPTSENFLFKVGVVIGDNEVYSEDVLSDDYNEGYSVDNLYGLAVGVEGRYQISDRVSMIGELGLGVLKGEFEGTNYYNNGGITLDFETYEYTKNYAELAVGPQFSLGYFYATLALTANYVEMHIEDETMAKGFTYGGKLSVGLMF